MEAMTGMLKTNAGKEAFKIGLTCGMNKEHYNAYIQQNPNFLKYFVTAANVFRQQQEQQEGSTACTIIEIENEELDEIGLMYGVVGTIFGLADHSVCRDNIPVHHYQLFAAHFCEVLSQVAQTPQWQTTGILSQRDGMLLNCAALMAQGSNRDCVQALLGVEDNPSFCQGESAFAVLAKLMNAHAITDATQAIDIMRLASEGLKVCVMVEKQEETSQNIYNAFHHFEACGFLGHLFVCMTVPTENDSSDANFRASCLRLLGNLSNEYRLVKKKLRPGTKAGDMLAAVVSQYHKGEEDDARPIMSALWRLYQQALVSDCEDEKVYVKSKNFGCHNCYAKCNAKFCTGCNIATYCSKECQRTHWKAHKTFCKKGNPGLLNHNMKATIAAQLTFLENNYIKIMTDLASFTKQHGCDFEHLLLEVDLYITAEGTYKIDKIDRYLKGARPAKPQWSTCSVDAILDELTRAISVKGNSARLQCIIRRKDGGVSILPLPDYTKWTPLALQYFPIEADENNAEALKLIASRQIDLWAVVQGGGNLRKAANLHYENKLKQVKAGNIDPYLFRKDEP